MNASSHIQYRAAARITPTATAATAQTTKQARARDDTRERASHEPARSRVRGDLDRRDRGAGRAADLERVDPPPRGEIGEIDRRVAGERGGRRRAAVPADREWPAAVGRHAERDRAAPVDIDEQPRGPGQRT